MKLNRNIFMLIIICMLTTLSLADQKKPNIVVILVDDMGYRDVGFTGCTDFKTPHIDALATGGVTFSQGYANHSFCAPTRAALMTGRYQHRFGFETNPAAAPKYQKGGLPTSEVTIAKRLKDAGYKTGVVGKWHLGHHGDHHPLNRGFDYFFGMPGGGHDYFRVDSTQPNQPYLHPLFDNKEYANVEGYLTHQLTDKALGFIDDNKDEPFFLFVSYNAPHAPWQAPQETIDSMPHIEHKLRRAYAGMMVEIDNDVGRIVKHLEKQGLTEDTLIFFFSDNGGPNYDVVTDNTPFREGKGALYEGGVHVPFVANWPSTLKAGSTFKYPVSGIDISQTAVELGGGNTDKMEGKNLIPYVTGKKDGAPHEYIFFRRRDAVVWAVRDAEGNKLIKPHWEGNNVELYDLNTDPGESNNLINERPTIAARLQAAWDEWNKDNIRYVFYDYPDYLKKEKAFHDSLKR